MSRLLPYGESLPGATQLGQCVEVADLAERGRAVRDSKDLTGPALRFSPGEWAAFTTGLRNGEFGCHPPGERPPAHPGAFLVQRVGCRSTSASIIRGMRQLLLRIPDDLHARLTSRARRAGRSMNMIATELSEQGVADESSDARATLRGRARRLGVLATAATVAVSATDREAAVNSARGIGPVLDELLADGR